MAAARKRPRGPETEESRAECPFSIRLVDGKEKEQKGKKRRKKSDAEEDVGAKKIFPQLSPFSPSGRFKTYETMDVHYTVEPAKKWSDMTRYNSFVLNSVKYFSEGFIYVANESTIERQKAITNKDQAVPRKRSDDDWVARILEIRASDEHHVYARVYWMYWPDELPVGTHDGKKSVQGRQPYHGTGELIASNHMDIINVVSVTSQAQVNQMIEDNDDDIQNALYWRQAIDVRTLELSSVEIVCNCGNPANPDKTLIGCTQDGCGKWLHDECLKHDALLKTFERLGRTVPHVKKADKADKNKDKDGDGGTRPLSPKETGAAVSAQHSINVSADGEGSGDEVRVNDNVEVRRTDEPATSEEPGGAGSSTDAAGGAHEGASGAGGAATPAGAAAGTPSKGTPGRKPGRPRKHAAGGAYDGKGKPWEGLFEAAPRMDLTPPMMEFTDLRDLGAGGEKTWLEPVHCLICGAQIQ